MQHLRKTGGGYIPQAKSFYLFTFLLHYLTASPAAPQVSGWRHSYRCWLSCTIRARLGSNVQGPQNTFEEFSREPCSGLFGGLRPMRPLPSARYLCLDEIGRASCRERV